MIKDNLTIKDSGIPHQPHHIVDADGNVIASLYHNFQSPLYARMFKIAPRMQKILFDVLENYSISINENNVTDKDLKILKDIAEIQAELLEPIDSRTETTWQDEVFEKNKDEPLADAFINPPTKKD